MFKVEGFSFKVITISIIACIGLLLLPSIAVAQKGEIFGNVVNENKKALVGVEILIKGLDKNVKTNSKGEFLISGIEYGTYQVLFFLSGYQKFERKITVDQPRLNLRRINLKSWEYELGEVEVQVVKQNNFGIERLKPVEGTAIYASKKSEVIVLDDINANKATNNSRQIFAKVAGLNIWESDGGGLQLGIGGRGLSPNRTSNFNTRQNGYDIAADALGYPESYYAPPSEIVKRIEVVRGAASLQYGTQFGGMLNFVLKEGSRSRKAEVNFGTTLGSFGLRSNELGVNGQINKLNYFTFVQFKQGDGWRDNSGFTNYTFFGGVKYALSEKLTAKLEYTFMDYNTQQAGGLTDALFKQNPRQSIRDRNWFHVNWNLAAFTFNYQLSNKTKLKSQFFGLHAKREALGYLGIINRVDPLENRDLIAGNFVNWGNESKLLHIYDFRGMPSVFLIGMRYYQGTTESKQGEANAGSDADYEFLNPNNLEHSDYLFPSKNWALFSENVFNFSPKFSVTPGIRIEKINTSSEGLFRTRVSDLAGNVLLDETRLDSRSRNRIFPLFGLGSSYKLFPNMELYGNFSQNYRAVNFNDLRIVNPNFRVDENIMDEKGYSSDVGIRGNHKNILSYDVSLFYLFYKDRIGVLLKTDENLFNTYRYRTNVSDSRNSGIETFIEVDIWKLLRGSEEKKQLSIFSNISHINAKYINSNETSIEDKNVELVPDWNIKTGVTFKENNFSVSYQFSYTGDQFTDATNAKFTSNAVNGLIPAYRVMDLTITYKIKKMSVSTGINNLLNNIYFTRRAAAYPGPGIIPAEGRSFFISLKGTF